VLALEATNEDKSAFVEALAEPGKISDSSRDIAITMAAQYGELENMLVLLEGGSLSEDIRMRALQGAAENGHVEVVLFLLGIGEIPQDNLKTALLRAVKNGHLPVVQALRDKQEFSKETRILVESAATLFNQTKIDQFLRGSSRETILHPSDLDPKITAEIYNRTEEASWVLK
jgi:ankyrin repeat protein